jgi:hypothetical protein
MWDQSKFSASLAAREWPAGAKAIPASILKLILQKSYSLNNILNGIHLFNLLHLSNKQKKRRFKKNLLLKFVLSLC